MRAYRQAIEGKGIVCEGILGIVICYLLQILNNWIITPNRRIGIERKIKTKIIILFGGLIIYFTFALHFKIYITNVSNAYHTTIST